MQMSRCVTSGMESILGRLARAPLRAAVAMSQLVRIALLQRVLERHDCWPRVLLRTSHSGSGRESDGSGQSTHLPARAQTISGMVEAGQLVKPAASAASGTTSAATR